MDGQAEQRTDGQMERTDGRTDGRTGKRMDRWQEDRRMDGWAEKMDRQSAGKNESNFLAQCGEMGTSAK